MTESYRLGFWKSLYKMKFYECYWVQYLVRAQRMQWAFIALCFLFFIGAVASQNYILLWPVVAIRLVVPYDKQIGGLKYMIPQLSQLVMEMENCWHSIDEYPDSGIQTLICEYEQRYLDLYNRYISSDYFPVNKAYEITAAEQAVEYLDTAHHK